VRSCGKGEAGWLGQSREREEGKENFPFSFYFQSFTNPISKAFENHFLIWSHPVITKIKVQQHECTNMYLSL
jgi:hypothetical protein